MVQEQMSLEDFFRPFAAFYPRLNDDPDPIELNMSLWHLYETEIEEESNSAANTEPAADNDDEQESEPDIIMPPKNLILYGPQIAIADFNNLQQK